MYFLQSDACIDILARSINELFSPIIEAGEGRREQSHDLDELTNLYERDQYGNFVTSRPERHSTHPKRRRTKNDQVESIFNQLARSQSDDEMVSRSKNNSLNGTTSGKNAINDTVRCSHNETDEPLRNIIIKIDENTLDEDEYEDGEYEDYEEDNHHEYHHPYHPRSTSYVPGRRPFVDLIIKLIETFQLSAESEHFITSRPKLTKNQFIPETDENYR